MEQQYQNGADAVKALALDFANETIGGEITQIHSNLMPGPGDGTVTGKVRLQMTVVVDLAIHPFPVVTADSDEPPASVEAG